MRIGYLLGLCLLVDACSMFNRDGPEVTCADLQNGAVNACSQGIIATCEQGVVDYRVCHASGACEHDWQVQGRFRCEASDVLPDLHAWRAAGDGADAGADDSTGCGSGNVCVAEMKVTADENGDGYANPGEHVTLEFAVSNGTAAEVDGLFANISSVPSDVSVEECFGAEGYCENGCACFHSGTLSLEPYAESLSVLQANILVDKGVEEGQELSFGIELRDQYGAVWNSAMALEIVKSGAELVVSDVMITSDDNSDLRLNPGENASLAIYARNAGTASAIGVYAVITDVPEVVSIVNCFGSSGYCEGSCSCSDGNGEDVPAGESSSYHLLLSPTIRIDAGAFTQTLDFGVEMRDAMGNAWSDSFSLDVVRP